jgi:hypothetical protein
MRPIFSGRIRALMFCEVIMAEFIVARSIKRSAPMGE